MAVRYIFEQIFNEQDLKEFNEANQVQIEFPEGEQLKALYQDASHVLNLVFENRLFLLKDEFVIEEDEGGEDIEITIPAGSIRPDLTDYDFTLIQKSLMALVLDTSNWLSFLEQTNKLSIQGDGTGASGSFSSYDPNQIHEYLPLIVKTYLRSCGLYLSIVNDDDGELIQINPDFYVQFSDLISDNVITLSPEWNNGELQSLTNWMFEVKEAIVESGGETSFTSGVFVNPEDDTTLEWPDIDSVPPFEFVSQQQINIANREFHFSLQNVDELLQSQIDDIKINNSTILNIKQVVPSNTISLVDGVRETLSFNTSGGGSVIDPLDYWSDPTAYIIPTGSALHGKDIRNQGSLTFNITGAIPNASLNIHYKINAFGGGSDFETTFSINIPNPADDEITIPFFNDLITLEDVSNTKVLSINISSNGDDFDFTLIRANWSIDVVGADTILVITNPFRLNELKEYETDQGASYTDKFGNVWTKISSTGIKSGIINKEHTITNRQLSSNWETIFTLPQEHFDNLISVFSTARDNNTLIHPSGTIDGSLVKQFSPTGVIFNVRDGTEGYLKNHIVFVGLNLNMKYEVSGVSGMNITYGVGYSYISYVLKTTYEYKLTTIGTKKEKKGGKND